MSAPGVPGVPAALLGRRVVAVEDITRPWTVGVRTALVTLDDGAVVVHQAGSPTVAGRAGIARRIRLGRALAGAAPGLPVPEVLAGDAGSGPDAPWLVTRCAPGVVGDALLETPVGAELLGRLAGETAAALAAVVPKGAVARAIPRRWADPGRLGACAAGWLAAAAPIFGAADARRAGAVVARVPGLLADPPTVAHGDLAPVNLVVDGGRLAGLLDLERLRLAPPGFDAAWFRLLVRHHHPDAWGHAGAPFLGALGLDEREAGTRRALDDLAVLACLEQFAALPRRSPAREGWAARAREALAG